jgi:hypothetical protein
LNKIAFKCGVLGSQDSVANTVIGYGLHDLGFESWKVQEIFLSSKMSRLTLGPIQPLIQWMLGALSLRIKQLGCDANHSPPSSVDVKYDGNYTSALSICLLACTGTTFCEDVTRMS